MRIRSIKLRVTMWYTVLFLLLLLLSAAYLFSVSSQISNRRMRETIMDVVADTVKSVEFKHGELKEEKIDFYRNGVSVFLYDTKGQLIVPQVNRGIQVDSLLEDQRIKKVDYAGERWMVYDLYAVQDETGFWVRGILSVTETKQTMDILLLLAFFAIPAFVLIASIGGWRITKKAFLPVKQMADTADAINSGMDLSLRILEDGSGDELSQLGCTINRMLERLQNSFEIERQFTSDASHELRTPITIMISQCEYALSETADKEEQKNAIHSILKQANRMSAMIGQLLLLARAENGNFEPKWDYVNLSQLCEMITLDMETEAEQKKIRIQCQIKPEIYLMGDEILLLRLISNLFSNAIRYNKAEGTIFFHLNQKKDCVSIEISDTGVGLKEEELKKIWNRFYRVDSSRSGEGTGLGLAMVKWIAELHDGQVKVESEYGKGSKFTVILPLEKIKKIL